MTEIEIFEKRFKFLLPEDFRNFLREIGYGAGPKYGVKSLREISNSIENRSRNNPLLDPITLFFNLKMFITVPIFFVVYKLGLIKNYRSIRLEKSHPERVFPLDRSHIDKINKRLNTTDWEESLDCGELLSNPTDGNIFICNPGGHFNIALITTGELRGGVWFMASDDPKSQWFPDDFSNEKKIVKNINFETWYENWLDLSLAKFDKENHRSSKL